MSFRSSVSRLLRTQVHWVLTKSVHSVAVIGARFSQGQVRDIPLLPVPDLVVMEGNGEPGSREKEGWPAGGRGKQAGSEIGCWASR